MPEPTKTDSAIRFHYIKSSAYRVVHVDGVVGGPTPGGLLHLSLFSERAPIPTMVEHRVTVTGDGRVRVEDEIGREGKRGLVREVEVGAVMTVDMAKKLHAWLTEQISKLEAAHAAATEQPETPDAG